MSVMNARRLMAARSFDHLVGESEQRRRDFQAERLGGLEIDNQFEAGGLLDGQIRRLRTLEDFVHVRSRPSVHLSEVRSIRDEATGFCKVSQSIHHWHTTAVREPRYFGSVAERQVVFQHYKCPGVFLRGRPKRSLEFAWASHPKRSKLQSQDIGCDHRLS